MDSSENEQSDIEFYDDSDTEFVPSSASESDLEYLLSDSDAENVDSETVENVPTENLSSPFEDETIWSNYEGRHCSFDFTGI